jgi:hypothetical protein
LKQCEWCNHAFKPSVSYQIYCNVACRDEATKEKIADRHKEIKRLKRATKERKCAAGCGTILSVYNDDTVCGSCFVNVRELNRKLKQVKAFMHNYEDKT